MDVSVSSRHIELSDSLRAVAEDAQGALDGRLRAQPGPLARGALRPCRLSVARIRRSRSCRGAAAEAPRAVVGTAQPVAVPRQQRDLGTAVVAVRRGIDGKRRAILELPLAPDALHMQEIGTANEATTRKHDVALLTQ